MPSVLQSKTNLYNQARGIHPNYTKFDLSHSRKISGKMGKLYPGCLMAMMPGDRIEIGAELVTRMMPMVAPVLHEIDAIYDFYFVTYSQLFEDFKLWLSGGPDGADVTELPRWTPSNINKTAEGSLWDFLSGPVNVIPSLCPVDFPRRAYNRIWNWHYRHQDLQSEVVENSNEEILYRNWENDYYTLALPFMQRGVAPALPVTGTLHPSYAADLWAQLHVRGTGDYLVQGDLPAGGSASLSPIELTATVAGSAQNDKLLKSKVLKAELEAANINMNQATTFDIADLREAMQIQRFMEINARCGVRWNEFLNAQYNIAPIDKTLHEPEFIGRIRTSVIVSEVLQTSMTSGTEVLGQMAGHGLSVKSEYVGKFTVTEPGLIMGLFTIIPRTAYQQGIDRPWLMQTKYDFPFPIFANLSEQQIKIGEIYCDGTNDDAPWGYIGRYDEYRVMHDSVHGLMKKTSGGLAHWQMGRIFASAPSVALDSNFVKADCATIETRCMKVPSQDTFVANIGNSINVIRALPKYSDPSIMEKL